MIAIEIINTLQPEPDWIHLYTDGYHANDIDIAGAGVYGSLFSFYFQVVKSRTAFDGEIALIRLALT